MKMVLCVQKVLTSFGGKTLYNYQDHLSLDSKVAGKQPKLVVIACKPNQINKSAKKKKPVMTWKQGHW